MKPYLIAPGAGLLVGMIDALLNVRSPAPPVIALVGLLGILVGEQLPPLAKWLLGRDGNMASVVHQSRHHVFGSLPSHGAAPSGAVRRPNESQA
ncbi:MAG: XapX domain-containing protein [Rhizobiales bacterium]|nr:XapX domain-containing protein [Rhizobacter sp.]